MTQIIPENMNTQKWPIASDFLSLRKGAFENTKDPKRDGMYLPDFIQGFLGSLAINAIIRQPLAIYQFVPLLDFDIDDDKIISITEKDEIDPYFNEILSDKKFIRIDSGELFPITKCCETFRKDQAINTKKCYCQDSRGILFFMANEKLKEYNDKSKFISILENIVEKYNVDKGLSPREQIHLGVINDEKEEFVYLYYRCKYSDFDEYIFPIFYESKIIAYMISGQIVSEDFDKKILLKSVITPKSLKNMKEAIKKLQYTPLLSIEQKIQKISKQTKILENRIVNNLDLKKQNFINQTFAEIKNEFLSDLSKINKEPDKALPQIKKYAGDALEKICNKFESFNVFIRIFAIDAHTINKTFRLFIKSDQINSDVDIYEFTVDIDTFLNDHFKNKEHICVLPLADEKRSELVNKFSHPDAIHGNDIFELLPTLSNNVSFIIWKRLGNRIERKEIKSLFEDKLSDFYILIAQIYATIVSVEHEKNLTDTIRIAGHETAQILPRIKNSLNNNFEASPSTLTELIRNGNYYLKIQDIQLQMKLIENIHQRTHFLLKKILIEGKDKSYVKLHQDVFFELRHLFSNDVKIKDVMINIPETDTRIEILVGRIYFEHALHNLLDNAVKYCLFRSKIHMRSKYEGRYLYLNIISYGSKIEDGRRIYDLYYRGKNQKDLKVEGLGVGMFIVEKVIDAHGGSIEHTSTLLSKYNIPLLVYLKEKSETYKKYITTDIQKAIDELNSLTIKDVANINKSYILGNREFYEEINIKTYRNDFCIKLPIDIIKNFLIL